MLLYRAILPVAVSEVVAVTVQPEPAPEVLGELPRHSLRLCLRYADSTGAVRTHRGRLVLSFQGTGRGESGWRVAGWQAQGNELLISVASVPVRTPAHGTTLGDRFALPFALEAWGVTRVTGAETDLQAVCRGGRQSLFIRGAVRLTLITAVSRLRLRLPFGRLLAAENVDGLTWRTVAGVTGFSVQVSPGGHIAGELTLSLCCAGRPPVSLPRSDAPAPALVRELTGRIIRVEAEALEEVTATGDPAAASQGASLLRGEAALDLYWADTAGKSRWTGRIVPFAGLLVVPGLLPGDRLQAEAALERIWPVVRGSQVTGHLLLRLAVTAFREVTGHLSGREFRLEEIVGRGERTLSVAEPLLVEPPRPAAGVQEEHAEMELPPGAWPETEQEATPEVRLELGQTRVERVPGGMRWQVPLRVGGQPAGNVQGCIAPDRKDAATGAAAAGTVAAGIAAAGGTTGRSGAISVAGLVRVGERSVSIRLRMLDAGDAAPLPAPAVGELVGAIDLPGPVSRILNLAILRREPWRVQALVALVPGGLWQGDAPVDWEGGSQPEPEAQVDRLTALPVQAGGRWRLRLAFGVAAVGTEDATENDREL